MTNTPTDTFPPLASSAYDRSHADDVELMLACLALNRPASLLDAGVAIEPRHFLDRTLGRIVGAAMQAAKADPAVELVEISISESLSDFTTLAELHKIKTAYDEKPQTTEAARRLSKRVIDGWRSRELQRITAIAFETGPIEKRLEAVQKGILSLQSAAPAAAAAQHPLAQFVTLRKVPQAVRWVVPGVIEEGVVTIAGTRGVGKTTALLPLALSVAGLHEPGYPLAPHPDRWRHIIYAVEQVSQAERILAGLVECSGLGITWEQVEERLHLVEAKRLNVGTVVQVSGTYREKFTRTVDGVEIKPLVVFDTQAASFDMDNENDNTEASRIMAALKQDFEGLPVWIVGHLAKTLIGRSDIPSLSMRGGGAFESDAIQNCYLIQEGVKRFLALGKRRGEPRFGVELMIEAGDKVVTGFNEWNEPEDVHLRWAIVRPSDMSRQEARQQAQDASERERRGDMREAIMNAVQVAWQAGSPINKTGVKGSVRGFKTQDVGNEVEALLAESWLHEVEVPKTLRTNTKRDRFLVRLSTEEHDAFKRSGIVPPAKLVIPQSWRKAEIPSVPTAEDADAGNQTQEP